MTSADVATVTGTHTYAEAGASVHLLMDAHAAPRATFTAHLSAVGPCESPQQMLAALPSLQAQSLGAVDVTTDDDGLAAGTVCTLTVPEGGAGWYVFLTKLSSLDAHASVHVTTT